jgi:uncharacterized membrane protein YccC
VTGDRAARAAALRRAGRLTAAGCTGFLVLRYGAGDRTTAVYTLFTVIALGALSEVTGRPGERGRALAGAGGAALVLVTAGTFAARSTAVAAVGMLAVGFTVAWAGVGGPRVVGLATGLQLFYILPCFPPYDPGSLPDRLAGVAAGTALLLLADRLLWPTAPPVSFPVLLAGAADAVGRYLAAVRADLLTGSTTAAAARPAAERAAAGLRLSALPAGRRPAGPGRRDRGLTQAAASLRVVQARTAVVEELLLGTRGTPVPVATADVLAAVGETLGAVAAALRDGGPGPTAAPLEAAVDRFRQRRQDELVALRGPVVLGPRLRAGVAAGAVAEAARLLVAATRVALGAGPDPAAPPPVTAWFVLAPTRLLWERRLRTHLSPRSVYLENAVRLALGLAAARVVAGVLDLSHGFWVLLATLTLMRTSLGATRAALLPAFAGTVGGAVLAAGLLVAIGGHEVGYAVTLPVVMLLALCAGPLLGPVAGQAGFTVLVAVLFAQVAPVTWRLAEVRVLDVAVGGLVGAAIGAAVWPRGSATEVARAAAACLREAAGTVEATVGALCEGTRTALPRQRLTALFDAAFAQLRSEPARGGGPDWMAVLGSVHHVLTDAQTLRARYPDPPGLPWPETARLLGAGAALVAEGFRAVAGDAARGGSPPGSPAGSPAGPPPRQGAPVAADLHAAIDRGTPRVDAATDPAAALRALDVWGWLHALPADLARAETALAPAPAGTSAPPVPAGAAR